MLILLSTVFGAISGVGIWFTIGVVHPAATSSLIHTFVWAWATEWAFFLLEVVTALAWVATWGKVSPADAPPPDLALRLRRVHVARGHPGDSRLHADARDAVSKTRSFWDGFLNPTYLPGILFRTGVCLLLGAACMAFAALREPDRAARARLSRILGAAGAVGLAVAGVGWFAWERALPRIGPAASSSATSRFSPRSRRAGRTRFGCSRPAAVLALLVLLLPRLQSWPRGGPRPPRRRRHPRAATRGSGRGSASRSSSREQMFSNGVLVSEIDR